MTCSSLGIYSMGEYHGCTRIKEKMLADRGIVMSVCVFSDNVWMMSKHGMNKEEICYKPQESSVNDVLTTF